jgi:aspartate aminotransferase
MDKFSLRPSFTKNPAMVSLAMGEPDFDTPPAIVDAAVTALRAGHTHYAELFGDSDLRDALAAEVSAVAGATFVRDQILVTHGASAALSALLGATIDPGDRVVIPEPTYSLYADLVVLYGGEPVFVPLTPDFALDFERLAPALRGAKMLVLCSPANPTGAVFSAAQWRTLVELVAGTSTLVVADEAYASIVYDGVPFVSGLSFPELREQFVYVQTLSKSHAMTGWRIGYLAGPAPVIKAAGSLHRVFNGPSNDFVQQAAIAALRPGNGMNADWLAHYTRRRAFVVEQLRAIAGLTVHEPAGAFYVLPRYDHAIASTDLLARLAEGGVAVRSGREFGPSGEHHFRISFATNLERLATGIERIAAVMATIPRGVAV